jgi:hypothetical protein
MENTVKLAVLIDAENAAPGIVDDLLTEIANYGIASVKRIYGDWTAPNLKVGKRFCYSIPSIPYSSSRTQKARTLRTAQ